jgi:hypothetical protein
MMARLYKIHRPLLLFSVLVILYESITKGWFVFLMVPLLLGVIPLLLTAQLMANKQIARGHAHPLVPRFMWTQLISAVLLYVCLPGIGDTEEVFLFGAIIMHVDTLLVNLSIAISFASFPAFFVSTILLFVFLAKRNQRHKQPPVVIDSRAG